MDLTTILCYMYMYIDILKVYLEIITDPQEVTKIVKQVSYSLSLIFPSGYILCKQSIFKSRK